MNAMQKVEEYKRNLLREMLSECTDSQQAFFNKIYPQGIDAMSDAQIKCAFGQVERTIEKNKVKVK